MKNKDLVILAILTLLTVVAWLVFEAIHTSNKSTITPVLQEQIRPIVPSFDTKVIDQLKGRQKQ